MSLTAQAKFGVGQELFRLGAIAQKVKELEEDEENFSKM